MPLRDYQQDLKHRVYDEWRKPGVRTVLATLATGGGKTVVFVDIARELAVPTVIVEHRSELVSQAALTLNREGLPHSILAPRDLIREIVRAQMTLHGRSLYSDRAPVRVAAVNTLAARREKIRWGRDVGLVIWDEAHHLIRGGVWNHAYDLFPNARGLGVSAHALRGDGLGLGVAADGFADALVQGPSARELIERGYLSEYGLALPPADVDTSAVPVGSSGDFSPVRLAAEVHKSKQLVGHVAEHYGRFAAGKLGLTFAVDIESAREIRAAYVALGVPAEVMTGETPIDERADMMRQFRARRILQIVSVDVLGEGTDVPDVEVVSMARPTASFQLFAQQLGRALRVGGCDQTGWDALTDEQRRARIAAGTKPRALLIDHVGNYCRHYAKRGMPCAPQRYSLTRVDRQTRSRSADVIPIRTCLNESCYQPYERSLLVCPHCGTPAPAPAGRSAPEQVDGDLVMLEPAALAALWAEVRRVDGPAPVLGSDAATMGARKNWRERQAAQATLRDAMMLWGGWRIHVHGDERRGQREFFLRFGQDVVTAQTLGAKDAEELETRIRADLEQKGVIAK